jgi:hypothetical protein
VLSVGTRAKSGDQARGDIGDNPAEVLKHLNGR